MATNIQKAEKILIEMRLNGIKAGKAIAESLGLSVFASDCGPGSRVEIWNKRWTRMIDSGSHVSKYAA